MLSPTHSAGHYTRIYPDLTISFFTKCAGKCNSIKRSDACKGLKLSSKGKCTFDSKNIEWLGLLLYLETSWIVSTIVHAGWSRRWERCWWPPAGWWTATPAPSSPCWTTWNSEPKYFSQVPRQLYSLLSIICNLLIRLQWKHFSALLTRNTWELNAKVFQEKRKLFVSPLCSNICQWKIRSRRRRWAPQSQDNRILSSSDHWSQQILSSRRSRESLQWSSLLSTLSTPAGGPSLVSQFPQLLVMFSNNNKQCQLK